MERQGEGKGRGRESRDLLLTKGGRVERQDWRKGEGRKSEREGNRVKVTGRVKGEGRVSPPNLKSKLRPCSHSRGRSILYPGKVCQVSAVAC